MSLARCNYTHILNQHHNFVNCFICKLPVICIFMQIDTAKFVAGKQKSRRQNVYDLENTLAGAEGFEPSADPPVMSRLL